MPAVLQIQDLMLGYPELTLTQHFSMDIEPGSTVAVVGANGSGKTTLIKTLLGILKPLEGQLHWPAGRPHEIGYLAQMTDFDRRFPMRVKDLAAMGQWKSLGLAGRLNRARQTRVSAALEATGVLNIADQPLHTLSGGQLQRAMFARVMVQDAPLILLDEPFAAVDQNTETHLLDIIDQWRAEGRAVLLIVHNLSTVLDHCSHAMLFGGGKASHGSTAEVLTSDRLVRQGYLSKNQAE